MQGCTGYLAHPFKKDGLGLPDRSFPLARNSMEGQTEPVLLAGWREEDSIRQEQRILSGSMRGGKSSGCRARGLLSKTS